MHLDEADALSLVAVLRRLKEMTPMPDPSMADIATEEGRLTFAEQKGRYSVVRDLESAIKRQQENGHGIPRPEASGDPGPAASGGSADS